MIEIVGVSLKKGGKIYYFSPNGLKLEKGNNVIVKTDLERTLDLLEEDLRTITVLYYYNDLSISEISDILNIPKGTVKSRVFRAREKLYEILSKEEVDTNE